MGRKHADDQAGEQNAAPALPENAGDKQSERVCFLISPISDLGTEVRHRADNVKDYVVKPAVEPLGYRVIRADEIADPGLIMRQIIDMLLNAPLVVADLTGPNPNVLYELAVRHMSRMPLVTIAEAGTRVPFDINQVRTIMFDHRDLRSVNQCIEHIRDQIRATEREDYSPDNPFTHAMSMRIWKASADAGVRQDAAVVERLDTIAASIAVLQRALTWLATPVVGETVAEPRSMARRIKDYEVRSAAAGMAASLGTAFGRIADTYAALTPEEREAIFGTSGSGNRPADWEAMIEAMNRASDTASPLESNE